MQNIFFPAGSAIEAATISFFSFLPFSPHNYLGLGEAEHDLFPTQIRMTLGEKALFDRLEKEGPWLLQRAAVESIARSIRERKVFSFTCNDLGGGTGAVS